MCGCALVSDGSPWVAHLVWPIPQFPITDWPSLVFSANTFNLPFALSLTLKDNNINTVAELTWICKNDIVGIRVIGNKGLEDINASLFKFGLRLKPVV